MGDLAIMGRMGDLKTVWDKSKPDEVEAARRQFNEMTKKGYLAFRVRGKDGEKGEQITYFDPEAERIILAPPMKGGGGG